MTAIHCEVQDDDRVHDGAEDGSPVSEKAFRHAFRDAVSESVAWLAAGDDVADDSDPGAQAELAAEERTAAKWCETPPSTEELATLRGRHHGLSAVARLWFSIADDAELLAVLVPWLASLDRWAMGPFERYVDAGDSLWPESWPVGCDAADAGRIAAIEQAIPCCERCKNQLSIGESSPCPDCEHAIDYDRRNPCCPKCLTPQATNELCDYCRDPKAWLAASQQRTTEQELIDTAPPFLRKVVEWNLATCHRRQPWLALAGAVALQAVLCGRRISDERDGRTNLQLVAIAGSTKGKEHSRTVNSRILDAAGLGQLEGGEDFTSGAAIAKAVEKSPALLVQLDEFGRTLAACADPRAPSHQREILTVLMKLRTSAHRQHWRAKSYADPKNDIEVDQPHLVLLGTTVPGLFFAALTGADVLSGWLGRLLPWFGDESPPEPDYRRKVSMTPPDDIVGLARAWGEWSPPGNGNLDWLHPEPMEIPYTPEALEHAIGWFEKWDRQATQDPKFAAIWGRTAEHTGGLALVACAARGIPTETTAIGIDDVRWACQLANYLTERFVAVARDHICDDPSDRLRREVVRHIVARPGITRSQLLKATKKSAKEVTEATFWLAEVGEISSIEKPPSSKGGRATQMFFLSSEHEREK